MARFWKRSGDRSVEQLLRAERPTPRKEFASSLVRRIEGAPPERRRVSAARYRLALVTAALLVGLAAAIGGIGAASAGLSGIFHTASHAVSPAKTDASFRESQVVKSGSSADDEYTVGVCHRTGAGTFNLIYVGPAAVPAHLAHGDHLAVNGGC